MSIEITEIDELDTYAKQTEMDRAREKEFEINKMFNIAEKVVTEYLCHYLEMTPDSLLVDSHACMNSEELILYPLEEYKKDKYLVFKLEMVPSDYQTRIPNELHDNKYVLDSLVFLQHAISEVFHAILHYNLTDEASRKALAASFHLDFDATNNTFFPVYIYTTRRQMNILTHCKENLEKFYSTHQTDNTWDTLSEEARSLWKSQYGQILSLLENLHYDKESADEKEKEVNEKLKIYPRIGVIFSEKVIEPEETLDLEPEETLDLEPEETLDLEPEETLHSE